MNMPEFQRWSWVGLLLAVFFQSQVPKKQGQQYYLKPDQTADLPSDTKLATARENCENWALAAGLETMLQQQKVPLNQSFWVMRLNGGELCVDKLPGMETLGTVVNRDFVLDDGRHVRLETHYTSGPPVNVDGLIAGLKLQQLSLLIWRGHPYYLTGVTYDERIGRDGTRSFEIKELRLANTYTKEPATTFQKGQDNLAEIGGLLSVTVTER